MIQPISCDLREWKHYLTSDTFTSHLTVRGQGPPLTPGIIFPCSLVYGSQKEKKKKHYHDESLGNAFLWIFDSHKSTKPNFSPKEINLDNKAFLIGLQIWDGWKWLHRQAEGSHTQNITECHIINEWWYLSEGRVGGAGVEMKNKGCIRCKLKCPTGKLNLFSKRLWFLLSL